MKVIIFRFGQLGDTVAAIPAIMAVRRHFRGCEIVLLSETASRAHHLAPSTVLGFTGLVDEFATYPRVGSLSGMVSALRCLRKHARESEALVYLAPSIRPCLRRLRDLLIFRLAGFRSILAASGFPKDPKPKNPDGSLQWVANESDALLYRLSLDGLEVPGPKQGSTDLRLHAAEEAAARDWLQARGLGSHAGQGWFAICPGSKWPSKLWPMERYEELGHRLIMEHGLVPVVVGGREDIPVAQALIAKWTCGHCAAGELGIRQSAALMGHALFYVGNDTGAMHLAAAVGTPCVGIFSAQDWPGRWEPYGKGHRVLRTQVPCEGCKLSECPNDVLCLRQISVDAAYAACLEVLKWIK